MKKNNPSKVVSPLTNNRRKNFSHYNRKICEQSIPDYPNGQTRPPLGLHTIWLRACAGPWCRHYGRAPRNSARCCFSVEFPEWRSSTCPRSYWRTLRPCYSAGKISRNQTFNINRLNVEFKHWLVDWLTEELVCSRTDTLIDWLTHQSESCIIGWLTSWLIAWLIDRWAALLKYWTVDRLIDWSIDWLSPPEMPEFASYSGHEPVVVRPLRWLMAAPMWMLTA